MQAVAECNREITIRSANATQFNIVISDFYLIFPGIKWDSKEPQTLTSEWSGGFPPSVALTTMVYLPPSTKSDLAGWIIVNSPETRWFMTNSWEMVGHDVINQVLGKNWQPGSKDSLLEPTISSCKLPHCKEIIRKSSLVYFISESTDTEQFQIGRFQVLRCFLPF